MKGSLFGFSKDKTLVYYLPKKKRSAILLSSPHNDAIIDCDTAEERETRNYDCLANAGIDVNDKLCAIYLVAKRTKRWPIVLFFH